MGAERGGEGRTRVITPPPPTLAILPKKKVSWLHNLASSKAKVLEKSDGLIKFREDGKIFSNVYRSRNVNSTVISFLLVTLHPIMSLLRTLIPC